MFDTRIDNGLVVHSFGKPRRESIGIRDGVIVALGDLGDAPANRVIDIDGAYVYPGVIDTHTHIGFTDPVKELSTEPRSAALGGVTTAMIYFRSGELYDEILPDFLEHGNRQSIIDFGVHLGILHDEHLERLPRYVEQFGIKSIKMYTTYKSGILKAYGVFGQDDGFIFDVLRTVAEMPDLIVNVHCENDDMAERGQRKWLRPGAGDV
jgi:dihydroorotase-like cyclic amidohydrolase